MDDLTPYLSQIAHLPFEQQRELLKLVEQLEFANKKQKATTGFLGFVKYMWPSFIEGSHHKIMARLFDDVVEGRKKRVIINIAPRHTKSEFASIHLPAYFLGRYPDKKIIMASHTSELAVGFGRKVRGLVDRKDFQQVFPGVRLSADSKAAGRWATSHGGEYFAIGVGGALAGKGADLCIDPESDVLTSKGYRKAHTIKVGDLLYGIAGFAPVRHVINSSHSATVTVNDLKFSKTHPVWVMGRGWVEASDIRENDEMLGLSLAEKFFINGRRSMEAVYEKLHAGIQHLGYDAPEMRKSQYPELRWLRRARDTGLRALGQVRRLLSGHGTTPIAAAYAGPQGQRWGLHPGELPLGRYRDADEQPVKFGEDHCLRRNQDNPAMGAEDRAFSRHDLSPNKSDGHGTRSSAESRAHELGAEGRRAEKRWRGSWKIRFLERSGTSERLQQAGYIQRAVWKGEDCLRFLLGIRRVKTVSVEEHEPRPFLNFHVEKHNTFFVGSSLVHNCIIDDPHSEQDAIIGEYNPEVYQKVMEWYEGGPRQRLQPGGAIIVVMTRWSLRDLTGQLLKKQLNSTTGDSWELIELPAILPSGNSLWPEYWTVDELTRTKNSIPVSKWNAQYMQQPTSEEGALIKREYWQDWEKTDKEGRIKPPKCEVIVQSWDTAFTTGTRADYSACTTWGIFRNEETEKNSIILLDAERGKWEFPGLKRRALELYTKHEPDICLIEGRAAGQPLIYEMRAMGLPVQEVTVGRGSTGAANDKISRVNSITDVFASQNVFAPKGKRWAQEVIEECAAFPAGEHDDYLDTVVMAMARFRQGGWLINDNDSWSEDDELVKKSERKKEYY